VRAVGRTLRFGVALLVCGAATASITSPAMAAAPQALVKFPAADGNGSGAGQLAGPRSVASDPTTGDVYLPETANDRVSEYTPWGAFVKAFGWDVAPSGVNEQQELRVRATSGQFTVSFGGSTTADLSFDAGAAELEAALNGLPSIAAGGGAVSVAGGPGGVAGTTPAVYTVSFDAGPLRETDLAQLQAATGTTPLSGGDPTTTLEVRTIADGTTAGTGLEACTAESGCKEGAGGGGAGQLQSPTGVAVDAAGNLYLFEKQNDRVQEFDSAGRFLLMFGGEVDKTTGANVCTKGDLEAGDQCAAGVIGTAPGFFSRTESLGAYIAVGSDGTVYVGDQDRIQEFEPDGSFKGQIKFADLHAEEPSFPESGSTGALAFDPVSEELYFSMFPPSEKVTAHPAIYKIDPTTGKLTDTIVTPAPFEGIIQALTTDPDGDLYEVFEPGSQSLERKDQEPRVIKFGPDGTVEIGFDDEFAAPFAPPRQEESTTLNGLGTNGEGDVYVTEGGRTRFVSSVSAYGPPPLAYGPPPKQPPSIAEQFSASVRETSATVIAEINPHFFADTTYYVEYGSQSCESGSCTVEPVPPGSTLTQEVVDAQVRTEGVGLASLQPDTTYHYRFVAQSSGGGPVVGLTGKSGAEAEGTFTTAPPALQRPACPANEAFRLGPGAFLPDCRAYEMVSPVDKNGGDISVAGNQSQKPAGVDQGAVGGDAITYSSYRAFGDAVSAPYSSQYLAVRGAGGWTSTGISPPREGGSLYNSSGISSQYKAFSPDLCQGWLLQDTLNPLASGAVAGWPNLYRRDLCAGGYTALAPRRVPKVKNEGTRGIAEFVPEVQGFSSDGSKTFIRSKGELANNASEASQVYELSGGKPRLVCILPDETPLAGPCSVGTGAVEVGGVDRDALVTHAVSEDGSVVYWTAAEKTKGNLYARVGGTSTVAVSAGEAQSAGEPQCTGEESAGEPQCPSEAQFWSATPDGSKAIFSEHESLYEFDLATKTATPIVGGFQGLMGASEDAEKVYLVSTEAEDTGATAGSPNLYLYEPGGHFRFIATLAVGDLGGRLSPVSTAPILHSAQVTPDGDAVAFTSVGRLKGFDNTDAASGEADAEVYIYRADPGALTCVSCNPTGARPTGRDIGIEKLTFQFSYWAAAYIPGAETQLHYPRVLSEDGRRLFFDSFDSLVPRDTNGKEDVYEWQAAADASACAADGGELFLAREGGCLGLISSGESSAGEGARDSELVDSSASGRDVFFKTYSSLVPQDPGLLDIYDARVEGGFASSPSPPEECEGEACRHPAPAPPERSPGSSAGTGTGNVKPSKPGQCKPGKHKVRRKGKVICVAKPKPKHNHKKQKHHRTKHRHDRHTKGGNGR